MGYQVVMFDGLPVTPYLTPSDVQDITAGGTVTSFTQLPGGGHFNNFGNRKRPKNLTPIHKTGVLWGDADEIHDQLSAWKVKEGTRGVLTVEWDDGALQWNYADLQSVLAPRSGSMKGGFLPIDLTWIKAGAGWRGPWHDDDGWVWGDGSWVFGDGTAEFGSGSDYTWTLPDDDHTITITNQGDIDIANLFLRFELTGTWQDITVINQTTGQQIVMNRASSDTSTWAEISAGANKIWTGGTIESIVSAARSSNEILFLTATSLGFGAGETGTVRLEGTGVYDGTYYPAVNNVSVISAFISPLNPAYGTVAVGTAQRVLDQYSVTTISDRSRWLTLVPGDNVLRVRVQPFPTSAILKAVFNDHYA